MAALTPGAHERFEIHHPDQVSAGARAARRWVLASGAPPEKAARAELCATELGTNLLRHAAPGGAILIGPTATDPAGVDVVAIDGGPGMDVEHAVAGGSTAGGMGLGLGSVQRLADGFFAYSRPGRGSVVVARMSVARRPEPVSPGLAVSGIGLPVKSGEPSGDGWAVARDGEILTVLVVDGLGHGAPAAAATRAAITVFARRGGAGDLVRFVEDAHEALRGTRGAALAVTRIHPARGTVLHVGVGNVEGRVVRGGAGQGLAGRSGTLGLAVAPTSLRMVESAWGPGAVLLVHSDGIRAGFELERNPGLAALDPAVVAAVCLREQERKRDDVTVVVVRDQRAP